MMRANERRRRVRALLAGDACVHPGSVFDPLSARAAEAIGFELGMFAGSTASLAVLGAPDQVLITLTEFAAQARRITRAAPGLPLLVDADHGYGGVGNAARTVVELEAAGVAAMTLEDTVLPVPFGAAGASLISVEEGVAKLRAALAARDDPDFVIVARTSAAAITGVDDAVARMQAYAAAGADAMFFAGLTEAAELDAIAAAATVPLIVSIAFGDRVGLAAQGVRVALQGHHPIQAAMQAVWATLRAQRDGLALPYPPEAGLVGRLVR